MKGRLVPLGIGLAFVLWLLARIALSLDRLPATMATHFDLSGQANGFQSRAGFAWTGALLCLFMYGLFALLPGLLARLPDRLINLPHKEYWLAPERRAETLARLGVLLDWLGCATVAFMAGVFELVIRANLRGVDLDQRFFWLLFLGYQLFMVVWIVSMLRGLRRP